MGSLRLILALSVFFWHVPGHPFRLVHGGIAVEAFFMISGFYMALVITEKYSKLSSSSWVSTFYQSRILRLAPTYLIICLFEGFLYIRHDTPNIFSANSLTLQARSALFFVNFFIFGQDTWQTILSHAPPTFQTLLLIPPQLFSEITLLSLYMSISVKPGRLG